MKSFLNRRILLSCFAWVALTAACGESAPAATDSLSAKLLTEARRIQTELKKTEYSHKTQVDEKAGSYAVDCSGFVCFVLKKLAPQHYKDVPKGEHKRPLAINFFEHFMSQPLVKRWRRIDRLADAQPGDLLAWRRDELTPGENTGHIVFVDAAPVREDDGQFKVAVLDSTASAHGSDTRKDGATGIGRGTMWFSVDPEGRPTGYRWRSKNGALREEAIAIGRALDE